MRLASFNCDQGSHVGAIIDQNTLLDLTVAVELARGSGKISADMSAPWTMVDLIAAGPDFLAACRSLIDDPSVAQAVLNLSKVELLAPIPRPLKNVFCVGSNYRAHVTEANRAQAKKDEAPKLPVFFTKPPTAVVGPHASIRLDPAVSEKMDYEVELGIVIGKAGRNIKLADAVDHIFGFTIINDVTARDLQRAHGGQYLKGKGLDTTCPMGPCIVTIDELPHFENLRIALRVNGELRQDGNTGNMIFPIPRLLESLSEGLTLEPGDVLATGTPSGVGYAMDPPQFLKDGDEITCEIEDVGKLTNFVRKAATEAAAA